MKQGRFWHIHLSTALLLMLTAGALVFANIRERRQTTQGVPGYVVQYGFPLFAIKAVRHVEEPPPNDEHNRAAALFENVQARGLIWVGLAVNVLFAAASLAGAKRRRDRPY
jgi:hypothetical protein